MKIAYRDKNCYISDKGEWEECIGCIFCQSKDVDSWPCDFIPKLTCYGGDIYLQEKNLNEIFKL